MRTIGAIDKKPRKQIVELPADEVIMRYRSGESCESISRSFGCATHTIIRKLKKWGVYVANRRFQQKTSIEDS